MKAFLILALLLSLSLLTTAQEVISSSGNYHNNSSGSITYTTGEPVIETFSGTSDILTQGFNQSKLVVTAVKETIGLDYSISVYPNPVEDYIILQCSSEIILGAQIELLSENGIILLQKEMEDTKTEISFNKLPSATYILRIIINGSEIISFKIVKTK